MIIACKRHLHQCPQVVSLTRQATSFLAPQEEELVLCSLQSADICDEYLDTSCTQVFSPIDFRALSVHFSTLAGLIQGHRTDSHVSHHDDGALRLDTQQSPRLTQQSKTMNQAVCFRGCLSSSSRRPMNVRLRSEVDLGARFPV